MSTNVIPIVENDDNDHNDDNDDNNDNDDDDDNNEFDKMTFSFKAFLMDYYKEEMLEECILQNENN
jgi:hypothetical protein